MLRRLLLRLFPVKISDQEVRAEAWALGSRHRGEIARGAQAELGVRGLAPRRSALLLAVIRAERARAGRHVSLPPGQLTALRNLDGKSAGVEVDWINIADARALTELGFAERSREGWRITDAGKALLSRADAAPDDNIVRLSPVPFQTPPPDERA